MTPSRCSSASSGRSRLRSLLLSWYRRHHRPLPWRATNDPYRIWVSEIMLQQTRVETVIPYYERFLQKFPTVHDLAGADRESVLKSWEGLGYYSRARNLHSAAKELVESYGGELPRTSDELSNLKGFGPYTSAAVASIAFGEPVAVVDGNVKRVISRLFATDRKIEETAQEIVDPEDPSSFNQAMMELGALICVPKNPRCLVCPLAGICLALNNNEVDVYPVKVRKKTPRVVRTVAVVWQYGDQVFLRKRPEIGLWGGLWEFPTVELGLQDSVATALEILKNQHGIQIVTLKRLGKFTHQLTHRTVELTLVRSLLKRKPRGRGGRWVKLKDLGQRPLSRLQQKAAAVAFPS